ncbi:MAG TPA: LytTR family DNA-binding domain-containing protein [Bacillota bacterium]|nr:LytTR family DNA-binding domain-containing protein [Bacillota bacterium]HOK69503.1 LytTR family DNA-binding domain-containing protein [Bacillota bacterium]HPP85582.1 LytTR family DNA-binding domain-containing protein [Bacillota bacterium]
MKIRIETVEGLQEDEVIIRCGRVDDTIQRIHNFIKEQSLLKTGFTFYKQNQEYYFPVEEVLFFETDDERVYAHTADDAFLMKYRLYELEEILPRCFIRVSKSTIVNTRKIYSIERNLTSSSLIKFADSHKHVYVSRHYYKQLKERMDERT